jgi:hypothetical protein
VKCTSCPTTVKCTSCPTTTWKCSAYATVKHVVACPTCRLA